MNVSFSVTSCSVIVQTSESGTSSAIEACIRSPGCTVIEIEIDGAGTSSHHAEYDAWPPETSCSVPVWISVSSPTVQPESTQPPPMPIQSDEFSS